MNTTTTVSETACRIERVIRKSEFVTSAEFIVHPRDGSESWSAAIAHYEHREGKVNRIISRQWALSIEGAAAMQQAIGMAIDWLVEDAAK